MDNYARNLLEQRLSKVNKDLEHEENNNLSTRKALDQSNLRISQLQAEQRDLISAMARIPD
jgi:hypothetical protein